MVRRSGLFSDAFTLRLPKAVPQPVLPPTPISPDEPLVSSQGHKLGQDQTQHASQGHATSEEDGLGIDFDGSCVEVHHLPYTPANTPPPDSPATLAEAGIAAEQTSLAHILASGYTLHPFLMDNYSILAELGSGGYGTVLRALRQQDMQEVAIKIVWRNKMPKEGWVAVTGWEPKLLTTPVLVPKEAHILRRIDHPGVISFLDYFEDEHFLYLVS